MEKGGAAAGMMGSSLPASLSSIRTNIRIRDTTG